MCKIKSETMKNLYSAMSNLQTDYHIKLDSQKLD